MEKEKRRASFSISPTVILIGDNAKKQRRPLLVLHIQSFDKLTSKTERVYPGESVVVIGGQKSKAIADQIMAADKTRLSSRIGILSKIDLKSVEDAIKMHLALHL